MTSKCVTKMSKAAGKVQRGPNTYPVIAKPETYTKLVETIRIHGREVTVESVNVYDRIHPSWHSFFFDMGYDFNIRLKKLFCLCYSVGLDPRPLPEEIYNVFSMSISDIVLVVVAQDPYPQIDQDTGFPIANGRCFATRALRTPPSLVRIREAIVKEFGPITVTDPAHPNSLKGWIDQGIFLLNNTPVYFGRGHLGYSSGMGDQDETDNQELRNIRASAKDCWKGLTEKICKHIVSEQRDCRFLLVGSEAHYLARHVSKAVCTSHPSTRSGCDFTGECFAQLRSFTVGKREVEIRWELM